MLTLVWDVGVAETSCGKEGVGMKTIKYFLFSLSICSIFFGTSFCVHQQNVQKLKRNLSSSGDVSDWQGPKTIQTPAGKLHVYHKVISGEPANVTYVDVKYTCEGANASKNWKRFKVQWFYGVDKTPPVGSIIPLIYDPLAELNFSKSDSKNPNDTKKTVSEEFNLETRCTRDQGF